MSPSQPSNLQRHNSFVIPDASFFCAIASASDHPIDRTINQRVAICSDHILIFAELHKELEGVP